MSTVIERERAEKAGMTRGEKEAVMTKLDADTARWVREQAQIFETNSAVVRLCVTVVRACIALGIVRWDLLSLQELLRRYRRNRALAPSDAGAEQGQGRLFAESGGALRPLLGCFGLSRQVREAAAVQDTGASHFSLPGFRPMFARGV